MPEQNNDPTFSRPETAFDAAHVLESISDAFFALDKDWRFTYINDQSERVMSRRREELLGRKFWVEFPAAVGASFARHYRRAMNEGEAVTFEEFYPPLDVWVEVRVYPSPGGISVFYQDITPRKKAEEALRRSQEDLQLAVNAARLGTFYCDYPLDKIFWNETCKEHFFLPPDAEVDFSLFYSLLHPDDREPTRQAIAQAMEQRSEYDVEYRTLAPDGRTRWINAVGRFYYDSEGKPTRFDGVTTDISTKKQAEEEARRRAAYERFLASLAQRTQSFTDPDAVIADAVCSVGRFLGVSRCIFADIDIEADTCTVRPDYRANASVASIEGVVPISAFGPFVVAEYAARRAVAVDDVRLDPIKAPPESIAAYEAIGIRAHVTVPVVHTGRVVSCMSVHNSTPRHWEPEEIALLRSVMERTWLTVEVLRQQQALTREAEELRAAHQRTVGILESITDAFFALDAQWRFTYVNAEAERVLFRAREELLNQNIWEAFPEAVGSTFDRQYRRALAEGSPVSFEEFFPPLSTWFEVRAYPSLDGLSVYFHDIGERKALEAERTQIAEREHRIAEQLQAALTPSVPGRIPGMALAKHYEAALAEAGVGGDFYDVFPMDKGCTALVVGDLSGKGLAAASQVATMRNMLRYALYRARTLAGALGGLNALLAEQGLLTGFATLFVGAYDSGAGTLTYVNCGQEPALIRRAVGGAAEHLAPTGPVLGSFDGAIFEARTVMLGSGDALAVFTDGLTEVGRSRTQMLGIEGIADMLVEAVTLEQTESAERESAEAAAEHLVRRLIAGIDAAAQGGVTRDDVCLLVGVVE